MKAVLRLAAIAALIATIAGNIVEYSDKALKDLEIANDDEIKAEVFNPDIEIEFTESEDPEEDAVYLAPTSTPDLSSPGVCEGTIGIKLTDTGDDYCGIVKYGIEVDYSENESKTLQLGLLFQSKQDKAKYLVLDVPIFVQPSKFAGAHKEKELENWAAENKVGTVSPVDSQTLKAILKKDKIKLTFKWLSDLLSYGVFKSKYTLFLGNSDVPADSFITQPIVLPKDVAQEFISIVEEIQNDLYIDMD